MVNASTRFTWAFRGRHHAQFCYEVFKEWTMDFEGYIKLGFPEHPCRYCLKRPTCTERCSEYWELAIDLKDQFKHLLADSTDNLLFNYLTLKGRMPPIKNLHVLPVKKREIKEWMTKI